MSKEKHLCSKEEEFSQLLVKQAEQEVKQKTFNETVGSIDKKMSWFLGAFIAFMTAITIPILLGTLSVGRYLDRTDRVIEDVKIVSDDVKDLQKEVSSVKAGLGEVKQWIKFNHDEK